MCYCSTKPFSILTLNPMLARRLRACLTKNCWWNECAQGTSKRSLSGVEGTIYNTLFMRYVFWGGFNRHMFLANKFAPYRHVARKMNTTIDSTRQLTHIQPLLVQFYNGLFSTASSSVHHKYHLWSFEYGLSVMPLETFSRFQAQASSNIF